VALIRTTFSLDQELAKRAKELGVNVSAAAREGVAGAVRAALARSDGEAYRKHSEHPDDFWREAEAWGERSPEASSGWPR